MMHVRLTQLDGSLANLALMKLSAWHRAQGDTVHFAREAYRQLGEPEYGRVYGSAIFSRTKPKVERFLAEFPNAIVGGTWNTADNRTVEEITGDEFDGLDYSH